MTLPTLLHVARNVIRESWLVCPECGGAIVLCVGKYWCDGHNTSTRCEPWCGFMAETLAPLRAVPKEAKT